MSQRQAIQNRLINDVSTVDGRVFVSRAPPMVESPYIVITKVTGGRRFDMMGPVGIDRSTWQISIFAQQETSNSPESIAEEILQEVRASLDTWRNADVGSTVEDNQVNDWEDDTGFFHIAIDYSIGFHE